MWIHSFIHSCNKHTYIQDLYARHELGTEGAQTMSPGPLQSGGETNMSMEVFHAVGEAPLPEVHLGCPGDQGTG